MWYFPLLVGHDVSKGDTMDPRAGAHGSPPLLVLALPFSDPLHTHIHTPVLGMPPDHVTVKSDLSNLAAALTWCKQHDADCEKMVQNANALYNKYLHEDGILDFMELLLHRTAIKCARTHCNMPAYCSRQQCVLTS